MRLLRFLYSVEKNRKAFKLIFPHEFFGAFIDVGNYNKEFQVYIPLLKRFNKKLPVMNHKLITIIIVKKLRVDSVKLSIDGHICQTRG